MNFHLLVFTKKHLFLFVLFIGINQLILGQTVTEDLDFQPISEWVKNYPKPIIKKEYSNLNYVRVHDESQYNHVEKVSYHRLFYYIKTKKGINELKSFNISYDPEYTEIDIHKIEIHRGKEQISLENNLHREVVKRTEFLGQNLYDDNARLEIYFDRLQERDLVEIAYSRRGEQPDYFDKLSSHSVIEGENFRGKNYDRILTHPNNPIYYTPLNFEADLKNQKEGKYNVLELVMTSDTFLEKQNVPSWYKTTKQIYFTDIPNWKELIDIHLKNHKLEILPTEAIQKKVLELTKNVPKKEDKILQVLNFIQRDIKYLDYALIEPRPAATVLQQGYGDCKSKSLLAIKMLECLNVNAYPVIVASYGLDDRLVNCHSSQVFNHEIIEFIYRGDTITFDATMDFQKGNIYQKYVNDFRYGLRIIEGNKELSKLKYENNSKVIFETVVTPEFILSDDETQYHIQQKIHFWGEISKRCTDVYENQGINRIGQEVLDDYYFTNKCTGINSNFEYSYTSNKDESYSILDAKFKKCKGFYRTHNGKISVIPEAMKRWLFSLTKDGDDSWHDNFRYTKIPQVEHHLKIALKDSMNFQPDTFSIENDWLQFSKKVWIEGDTIYADYFAMALKPFINSDDDELMLTIDTIQRLLDVFVTKADIFSIEDDYDYKRSIWDQIISIGLLVLMVAVVFINFRVLIKRKQRIRVLESENKELKKQVEGFSESIDN